LKKYGKLFKIIGLVIVAIIFYFAGYLVGHRNFVFEKNYRPKIINKELYKPRTVDFSLFWQAWNTVTEKYVGTPDYQKMIYGAISGMVDGLGDPYSSFMEPSATKSFMDELSGSISGIGAEIEKKEGILVIVSPLSDSPAEKAGLLPSDQILKIDDQNTIDLDLNQAIDKIRGKAGTKVKLNIIREGWEAPRDFTITREKIVIKSVKWQIRDDNIAYVEVSQFGDDTTDLLQQAAKEISDKKPKAVILDLRSNPGGYLDSSVDMASLWMDQGSVVVQEKNKNGSIIELKTTLEPILKNYKTIVLINKGSASASEIVAGALQDAGRATIVGETSFGKGSVQELEPLSDKSTLRVTVAKWLTPKGRAIDLIGITPDFNIVLTEDDYNKGKDPQLDKALELAK
jgi:carboxyl-terminal processing protease